MRKDADDHLTMAQARISLLEAARAELEATMWEIIHCAAEVVRCDHCRDIATAALARRYGPPLC